MVENIFGEHCLSSFGDVLLVLDLPAERGESFFQSGIGGVANLIPSSSLNAMA